MLFEIQVLHQVCKAFCTVVQYFEDIGPAFLSGDTKWGLLCGTGFILVHFVGFMWYSTLNQEMGYHPHSLHCQRDLSFWSWRLSVSTCNHVAIILFTGLHRKSFVSWLRAELLLRDWRLVCFTNNTNVFYRRKDSWVLIKKHFFLLHEYLQNNTTGVLNFSRILKGKDM